MRILIAAGVLLAILQTSAAAFGRVYNAPWCVNYVYLEQAEDCAYYSFQQCEEARSAVGGYCYPNPRRPYGEQRQRAQRRSHRH